MDSKENEKTSFPVFVDTYFPQSLHPAEELIENIQADAQRRIYEDASYKFKETRADRRKLKMAIKKNKFKKRY